MEALRQLAEFQNAAVVPGLTILAGMGVVQRPFDAAIIEVLRAPFAISKIHSLP